MMMQQELKQLEQDETQTGMPVPFVEWGAEKVPG
jgi:hypothetical protein